MEDEERCAHCNQRGALRCGRCRRVHYCTKDHQRLHWKAGHRQECKPQAAVTRPSVPAEVQHHLDGVQAGHPLAYYNLGVLYEKGRGVPQDLHLAFTHYTEAAKRGVKQALFNLGVMHAEGKGVGRDFKQAAEYYKQASEVGDAHAQNNLAALYANGLGVALNYGEAVRWYLSLIHISEPTRPY
eukprot:TRINITY_DN38413_c0_g1_i1.p1 TRINITY_DN38413_c0_g1~~TRINITY_DN38413_c0_g1_i1.p1  ORF type:complete len:184 (-),score=26.90 TRINITY_DN38413_c0_g1_i1:41-592(-)